MRGVVGSRHIHVIGERPDEMMLDSVLTLMYSDISGLDKAYVAIGTCTEIHLAPNLKQETDSVRHICGRIAESITNCG